MRFHVGTSGFAYPAWRGSFYPEDLNTAGFLPYYAGNFSTVEINVTFYRMPKADMLAGWADTVPAEFNFALKAPSRITHILRLKDAGDPLKVLVTAMAALKSRRGPLLVQIPPNLKKDVPRLADFLGALRESGDPGPTAFEVRHASWLDDAVYDLLRASRVALAAVDAEGAAGEDVGAPLLRTAGFAYVRLRRPAYEDRDLARWVEALRALGLPAAYVYFKHEDAGAGPRLAKRFLELAAKLDVEGAPLQPGALNEVGPARFAQAVERAAVEAANPKPKPKPKPKPAPEAAPPAGKKGASTAPKPAAEKADAAPDKARKGPKGTAKPKARG